MMARIALIALAAVSCVAMLYVGAYQVRAVQHLRCPLLKHGCEAVADAKFARPFGIPDGFLAAGLYAIIIGLALWRSPAAWNGYALRGVVILAAAANGLGVWDMARLGQFCFYCLVTTILSPLLVWAALVV
jgi:uncharacterized membrane protein